MTNQPVKVPTDEELREIARKMYNIGQSERVDKLQRVRDRTAAAKDAEIAELKKLLRRCAKVMGGRGALGEDLNATKL